MRVKKSTIITAARVILFCVLTMAFYGCGNEQPPERHIEIIEKQKIEDTAVQQPNASSDDEEMVHPPLVCRMTYYDQQILRASLFEGQYRYMPIGLRLFERTDELFSNGASEVFAHISTRHGYTYFDFTGEGKASVVAFAVSVRYDEGTDVSVRDTVVIAEVDGALHYAWLHVNEVWPRIVAPITHWDGDQTNYQGTPALLVVVGDLVANDHIFILTFEEGELKIRWLNRDLY